MTGAEWRALLPYVARDVSMFKANDIWVGDGHTFKARVQSPIHGQAFRPEVTVIIDDCELSLREFGRLLLTYAGWGMRVVFVPDDRIDEEPEIEVREPDRG